MAQKKQTIDKDITDIRALIKDGSLTIGSNKTVEGVKAGKVSKVYLSKNCPASVREEILHLDGISKIEIVDLQYPGSELGILSKKPYAINVLGKKR